MNCIQKQLFSLRDEKYAKFAANLTPNVDASLFIGVRVPESRKLAKKLINEKETIKFLNSLPHKYYDENMLHSLLINEIKDYDLAIKYIDEFLPYIDNWAVCDILSPKCFKKHKKELIKKIKVWIKSKDVYTCRFAIEMLMSFYLDEDFDPDYLKLVSKVRSKEYYVNMMLAWYYATALAKKWDETIVYIEDKLLDSWVINKTIQKAIESYRISDSQKQYLRTLKIK